MNLCLNTENSGKNKLTVAQECILSILSLLKANDSLGIIVFDHKAEILELIDLVKNKDRNSIRERVMSLKPRYFIEISEKLHIIFVNLLK